MRRRQITQTAELDLQSNYRYLAERAPRAAEAYYQMALHIFENFPDDFRMPTRASEALPEHVRVMHLGSPFRGYTLYVAFEDDALYLVGAFAPGLPNEYKNYRTWSGMNET